MNDAAKLARISEIMLAWGNRSDDDETPDSTYLDNIMEALDGRTLAGLQLAKGGDA